MNWIKSRYLGLSIRDRKLMWAFIFVSLIAGYLFWAAMTWQQMFQVEKLANRKANRIETRLGDIKMPSAENTVSEQDLHAVQAKLKAYEGQLQSLGSNMLPLHESGPREQLKLELTRLAELHHLRIGSFKTLGTAQRAPVENLRGQALREYFTGRPRFQLSLVGDYFNLINFVDGLRGLSHQTYVGDFSIVLDETAAQRLQVTLLIHI